MSEDKINNRVLIAMDTGLNAAIALIWALNNYKPENITIAWFNLGGVLSRIKDLNKFIKKVENDYKTVLKRVTFTFSTITTINNKEIPLLFDYPANQEKDSIQFYPDLAAFKLFVLGSFLDKFKNDYEELVFCGNKVKNEEIFFEFQKLDGNRTYLDDLLFVLSGSDEKTYKDVYLRFPLEKFKKSELFQKAYEHDYLLEVINFTTDCLKGSMKANVWGRGCGECIKCKQRRTGFYNFLGLHDSYDVIKELADNYDFLLKPIPKD